MEEELKNTISEISKKFKPLELIKIIKSGKEANVYLVDSDSELYALKIYRPNTVMTSKNEYTAGKYIREKSLRKAVSKKNKVGKNLIRKLWTRREFYMLEKFYEQGASVPKVFAFTDISILMQYLGDIGAPAQRLVDTKLTPNERNLASQMVIKSMQLFFKNGVVHGDLSEYNILWWQDKPFIIDFPQALDIKKNPNWETLLVRDIKNVCKYFNINNEQETIKSIIG